jgi:DNA-binding MarR family transcriptional regulator
MTQVIAPPPAQFLRSDAIRGGMDLLMFAHKSHLRHSDEALAGRGLGRAHHRVLYFLSRRPGGSVTDLLLTLGITKQSLGRVTRELREQGLIEARPGSRDRRVKLMFLTDDGERLEHELFEELHQNMSRAYAAAGEEAVRGYWTLMQHLMDEASHERFLAFAGHRAASGTDRA